MVLQEKPTDRGYAWIILLAVSLQMMLTIGIVKTSGLLFVTFQERFGSNSATTSLLSTVQNIFFSITSLFVTTIGIKITTCRNLVFAGSIILCLAFIVTSQAENISVLLLSHGALHGMAVAFNENAFLVMLSHYFEKRRGFANSIASCGSCIGGLLFAPLIVKLLSIYGYNGSLLIVAGILLNGCVSGALFRPTSFYAVKDKYINSDNGKMKLLEDRLDDVDKASDSEQRQKSPEHRNHTCRLKCDDNEKSMKPGDVNFNTNKHGAETTSLTSTTILNTNKMANDTYNRRDGKRHSTSSEPSMSSNVDDMTISPTANNVDSEYVTNSFVDLFDIHGNSRDRQEIHGKNAKETDMPFKIKIQKCMKYLIDYELFKRPVFICFLLAACTICPGTVLAQVFIPPYARDIGISVENVASLITIYNIVDICARIFISFVADRGWLRRSTIAAIATAIIALNSHFLRFYTNYNLIIVCVICQSLVGGVYFSLFPVILVDYMTLEKLQNCIGFVSLCHGFSIAGSFYMIGYLRDVTGSYLIPYHVIGSVASIGAILMFLLPFIEKNEKST